MPVTTWDDYPWDVHTKWFRENVPAILSGKMDILESPELHAVKKDPRGHLIAAAEHLTGIPRAELFGCTRVQHVCDTRFVLWLILTDDYGMSSVTIGRYFNRDHTTILHGVRKARQWLGTQIEFAALHRRTRELLELT